MIIKANCKINLGLDVVRKREDGYHELETVMLPVVGLYDIVTVEPMASGVEFRGVGIEVDCPMENNLCVRAARLMQERYNVGGVSIVLDKRVPFGAGLGGGSSDATAVIVAINDIYNIGLDKVELSALAAELGSDTPFFVYNSPMLCTGRGEIMTPAKVDLSGLWLVVAKPREGVSTAEAYRGVKPALPTTPLTELLSRPIEEWQGSVKNDFEPHILAAHPDILAIKNRMLDAGAVYVSMSGSGSAVFGLFRERPNIAFADDVFVHIEQC
ncbi:MAG: 4-(cytidine 5'-diphospho)-2-C-methyl-D-erythritol kinase [Alistipes sp.]|nr:4-(cytidine 5'-diphospho)-2-C-methyl-D-erythritol kinase [Alistipes sp.]